MNKNFFINFIVLTKEKIMIMIKITIIFFKELKYIHLPKVDFLRQAIKSKIKVLDIGAGSGQFLKALELRKIKAIGYEPSKSFVKVGKKF